MYIPGTTYLHILLHIRVFFINIYYPQYTVLHILSHCTSYTLFYYLFPSSFSPIFIYIYSLVLCFIVLLLMLFLFSILSLLFYFFCTVHWADLSRPTFHYWLYPVWLCMWQIIKNLEPWYSCRLTVNNRLTRVGCRLRKITEMNIPTQNTSKYQAPYNFSVWICSFDHLYTEYVISILVHHLQSRPPVFFYLDATGGVVLKIPEQLKL